MYYMINKQSINITADLNDYHSLFPKQYIPYICMYIYVRMYLLYLVKLSAPEARSINGT